MTELVIGFAFGALWLACGEVVVWWYHNTRSTK